MLANRGSFGSMKVSNLDKRRLFEINRFFLLLAFQPDPLFWNYSPATPVRSHTVLFLVICRIQASSQIRGRMWDLGWSHLLFLERLFVVRTRSLCTFSDRFGYQCYIDYNNIGSRSGLRNYTYWQKLRFHFKCIQKNFYRYSIIFQSIRFKEWEIFNFYYRSYSILFINSSSSFFRNSIIPCWFFVSFSLKSFSTPNVTIFFYPDDL